MTLAARIGSWRSGSTAVPFALVLAAVLALELAWMSVIGPFRGIDEFEHVYRADSVAHGRWLAEPDGRVVVDRDLYEDADVACRSRKLDAECTATPGPEAGQVEVVSTAAAYNPVFYAVVGSLSSPFHGSGQLYAMRIVLMVLNALVVALALTVTLRCFVTRWAALGVALTLTPQSVAAGMVVAPNGLENSAALLLWTCLLAAALGTAESPWRRWLPLGAGLAGVLLAVLRTLGPLWLVGVVGLVVIAVGVREGRGLRRAGVELRAVLAQRAWILCAVAWVVACAAGVAWSLGAGTNSLQSVQASGSSDLSASSLSGGTDDPAGPVVLAFVWMCQAVGALPYRNEFLPLALYGLVFFLWALVAVGGLLRAPARLRTCVALLVVASFLVPFTFGVASGHADLWQGRYGWPLALGFFLLLGVALDRREPQVPLRAHRWVVWSASAVSAVVMAWSLVHVRGTEQVDNPLVGDPSWWLLPNVALVALALAASAALALVVAPGRQTVADGVQAQPGRRMVETGRRQAEAAATQRSNDA